MGVDYAYVAMTAEQGWAWCMESPQARDGSELVFPLWEVTAIDDARHYRISKIVPNVPVEGDATGLVVGATVSVEAEFEWNGGVPVARARTLEIHVLRAWKERLGILGFVVLGAALPFCFVVKREGDKRFLEERGADG